MLCRETVTASSEHRTKHINILCEQSAGLNNSQCALRVNHTCSLQSINSYSTPSHSSFCIYHYTPALKHHFSSQYVSPFYPTSCTQIQCPLHRHETNVINIYIAPHRKHIVSPLHRPAGKMLFRWGEK